MFKNGLNLSEGGKGVIAEIGVGSSSRRTRPASSVSLRAPLVSTGMTTKRVIDPEASPCDRASLTPGPCLGVMGSRATHGLRVWCGEWMAG